MTILFIIRKKEYPIEWEKGIDLQQALAKLDFSAETHLAIRNGEMLAVGDILSDGDVVRIISAVAGG